MRIALLSDIHSNYFALEAVIDDIKQRGAELTINLGDSFYGPILPKATYDLLISFDFINIRGNQDRQIYETNQEQLNHNPTMNYVINDLGKEPLDWMKSLPPDKQLNEKIYLCHGSPGSDLIYLLEDIKSGWKVEHIKIPYNYRKAAEEAKKHKREDWAYFLTTGRGLK